MNINDILFIILTFFLMVGVATLNSANGREHKKAVYESFVIKDKRGVRTGRIVTDFVRGGYKIQNNYGVTIGRIKGGKLPNKITIERKR